MADEASIRECHGVANIAQDKFLVAHERSASVLVAIGSVELSLTPAAADRLATMLRRCARRVRERQAPLPPGDQ